MFLHCRYTITTTFQILQFLSVNGPNFPYIKLLGQKKESKELCAAMNGNHKPQETGGTAYSLQSFQKLQPHLKVQAENKAYLNLFSCLPDYSRTIWPQICLPWLKKYTKIKFFKVYTDPSLSCVSVLEAVLSCDLPATFRTATTYVTKIRKFLKEHCYCVIEHNS